MNTVVGIIFSKHSHGFDPFHDGLNICFQNIFRNHKLDHVLKDPIDIIPYHK